MHSTQRRKDYQCASATASASKWFNKKKKKMEGDDSLTALLTSFSLQPAFSLPCEYQTTSRKKSRRKKP